MSGVLCDPEDEFFVPGPSLPTPAFAQYVERLEQALREIRGKAGTVYWSHADTVRVAHAALEGEVEA